MRGYPGEPSRRAVLAGLGGLGLSAILAGHAPAGHASAVGAEGMLSRPVPASGERVPAIGMGTWITFNVGSDPDLREQRREVLRTFFERGGAVIDSSPMYGSAEAVLGAGLAQLPSEAKAGLFSATKVWTPLQGHGEAQMAESRELWGLPRFDLMQVHNLLNWSGHLQTLEADKAVGRVRLIGITTSHGRRHAEMEEVMRTRPIDAVQLTYNVLDRAAEERLLPLAADLGQAVVVNRPFRQKALFRQFGHHPLPGWAGEIGCRAWSQIFLKFIVSHPAVTCAIPATTRVDHMMENMDAMYGPLPDPALRARMIRDIEAL